MAGFGKEWIGNYEYNGNREMMDRDFKVLHFVCDKSDRLVVVVVVVVMRDKESEVKKSKMGRNVQFFCMYFEVIVNE